MDRQTMSDVEVKRVIGNAPLSYRAKCECGWVAFALTPDQARFEYDEHWDTDPRHPDPIYLPSEVEMMAARGAIVSLVESVARGNLEPRSEVLDGIILSVVRSLGWRPYEPGCDGKCARYECICPQ